MAQRAVRQIPREPASVIPALIVPIFFYVLNIGALSKVTGAAAHIDFKSFELPVAVVFAVTGVSRASSLVTDIQNGYFDRLTITPVRRLPLLLGLMMADLALVMALAVPVLARRPRPRGPFLAPVSPAWSSSSSSRGSGASSSPVSPTPSL